MARPKKMKKDMAVSDKLKLDAYKSGVNPNSSLVKNGMLPDLIKQLDELRSIKGSGKESASNLIQELFDKYNDKISNGVPNDLENYIYKNIIYIRDMINNLIKYSDPRIFNILPKDFYEQAKVYGWVAQEYFEKLLNRCSGQQVLVVPTNYIQCHHCGKYRSPYHFFKSSSDIGNGYLYVCKDCVNSLFLKYLKKYKDIRETLIIISHKLDLYVYEPLLEKFCKNYDTISGKQDIEDGIFMSKYIGELNLQKKFYPEMSDCNFEDTKLEGVPFKCIQNVLPVPPIYHDKFEVEVVNDIPDDDQEIFDDREDFRLSERMLKKLEYKFGKYQPEDLKWLEKRYREWDNAYDISQLNTQKIIIQMCCDELSIVKQREQGVDVGKQWKVFLQSMNTLALTPKQQAKDSNSNNFSSVTEFIKEVEKHRPVVARSKEFEDIDGIMRFVIANTGSLARTLDIPNEYTELFDKMYEPFTSSLLELDDNNTPYEFLEEDEDGEKFAEE